MTRYLQTHEIPTNLYLGGVPTLTPHNQMGFVGCISEVFINGKKIKVSPHYRSQTSVGISSCQTGEGRVCDNGGICQVRIASVDKFI